MKRKSPFPGVLAVLIIIAFSFYLLHWGFKHKHIEQKPPPDSFGSRFLKPDTTTINFDNTLTIIHDSCRITDVDNTGWEMHHGNPDSPMVNITPNLSISSTTILSALKFEPILNHSQIPSKHKKQTPFYGIAGILPDGFQLIMGDPNKKVIRGIADTLPKDIRTLDSQSIDHIRKGSFMPLYSGRRSVVYNISPPHGYYNESINDTPRLSGDIVTQGTWDSIRRVQDSLFGGFDPLPNIIDISDENTITYQDSTYSLCYAIMGDKFYPGYQSKILNSQDAPAVGMAIYRLVWQKTYKNKEGDYKHEYFFLNHKRVPDNILIWQVIKVKEQH